MKLINFFKSVGTEMKLVVWPNKHQTRIDTSTVVGMSVVFAIFFAIIDWAIQSGLTFI
ncbi:MULTISPECIES: preprotein translocase subunit SecE [Apilactobacillus]|uniref:Protein translocase subunit SecE n=2 Tax=Apilactobacillus TaxID=2767877 RepID=A0A2S2JLH8_9LACO|nr:MULTISPECIES: preprotein translocase subunit SecE [Apilactobacillus]TPR12527.1 preprotein translocase subunit SecE [Apilactobacillus timberlakei]TPR13358.1 preprotein translocase subunit SecE [Apilactobacillus timberlakei]TPR17691.1 preprotein translocase subunit SecE [Apilactobacillus timberlakei]TPR17907.1 preprotein translocase subunit SecE [Apilactobacillus timberlakei]TPR19713.1 preprotein translocase subunit SecE [Apilactobacillus timberlakei]